MSTSEAMSEDERISPEERVIVDIVRLNRATPRKQVRRQLRLWGWEVVYTRRSKDNLWGRFGGGWNWKLGFQAGGSTLIVELLVSSVRISRVKP